MRWGSVVRSIIGALCVVMSASLCAAQETINSASVSGRVDRSAGRRGPRRADQGAPDGNQRRVGDGDGSKRALPFSVLESRTVRDLGQPAGVQGRDADAEPDRRLRLRPADRAHGRRRRHQRHRDGRGDDPRSRSQPDGRDRLAGGSARACRSTAGTSSTSRFWCPACRPPTSRARSCSPRRQPSPAAACRSGVSATSPTASSWTACRPTTMRRG